MSMSLRCQRQIDRPLTYRPVPGIRPVAAAPGLNSIGRRAKVQQKAHARSLTGLNRPMQRCESLVVAENQQRAVRFNQRSQPPDVAFCCCRVNFVRSGAEPSRCPRPLDDHGHILVPTVTRDGRQRLVPVASVRQGRRPASNRVSDDVLHDPPAPRNAVAAYTNTPHAPGSDRALPGLARGQRSPSSAARNIAQMSAGSQPHVPGLSRHSESVGAGAINCTEFSATGSCCHASQRLQPLGSRRHWPKTAGTPVPRHQP